MVALSCEACINGARAPPSNGRRAAGAAGPGRGQAQHGAAPGRGGGRTLGVGGPRDGAGGAGTVGRRRLLLTGARLVSGAPEEERGKGGRYWLKSKAIQEEEAGAQERSEVACRWPRRWGREGKEGIGQGTFLGVRSLQKRGSRYVRLRGGECRGHARRQGGSQRLGGVDGRWVAGGGKSGPRGRSAAAHENWNRIARGTPGVKT